MMIEKDVGVKRKTKLKRKDRKKEEVLVIRTHF